MPHPGPWRSTVSALLANLVGIGLARFAYSPLIPALVAEGWFSASAAAYLGAANLAPCRPAPWDGGWAPPGLSSP
jgi:hypothetical protein